MVKLNNTIKKEIVVHAIYQYEDPWQKCYEKKWYFLDPDTVSSFLNSGFWKFGRYHRERIFPTSNPTIIKRARKLTEEWEECESGRVDHFDSQQRHDPSNDEYVVLDFD